MVTCPFCRSAVPAGANVCQHCGQALPEADVVHEVKDPSTGPLYEVHSREYFRKAWAIFKLYPAGFLGFSLIFLLIATALGRLTHEAPFIGFLLGTILVPLHTGLYIVSAKLLQGQSGRFEDFFAGFRYFKPLIIFGLFAGIVARLGYFLPEDFLLRVLCHLAFLGFMVLFFFTPLLIVDRRLDWWDAMELSRQTVQRRWLAILWFLLLGCLVTASGFLALIVGSLVTMPLFFSAITAAYADLFGLQSKEY